MPRGSMSCKPGVFGYNNLRLRRKALNRVKSGYYKILNNIIKEKETVE